MLVLFEIALTNTWLGLGGMNCKEDEMDRCDEQIGLYRMKMSYKGVPKRNESVRDEGRIRSPHMSPLSRQESSIKGYYLDSTIPSNHLSNLACSLSCSNHAQ